MPFYEHVFLARQDISQAQVEALTKEYGEVISEGGGRFGKTEYWGLKSLAFKIKKNRMHLKIPDGDKKNREYEVVAMKPLNTGEGSTQDTAYRSSDRPAPYRARAPKG